MKKQVSFGEFEIARVGPRGVTEHEHGRNTVVYEGMDLLALMIAGLAPEGLNAMYLEFEDDNAVPTAISQPVINLDAGRSYYAALEVDALVTKRDYLRVSLAAAPTLDTTDATKYVQNRVLFIASSLGQTAGEGGLPFSVARLSTVYGMALVNAPDANDRTQDSVFARTYDFTPKVYATNEQVQLWWRHSVTEDGISSSSSS